METFPQRRQQKINGQEKGTTLEEKKWGSHLPKPCMLRMTSGNLVGKTLAEKLPLLKKDESSAALQSSSTTGCVCRARVHWWYEPGRIRPVDGMQDERLWRQLKHVSGQKPSLSTFLRSAKYNLILLFVQKVVSKPQTTKQAGGEGEKICIQSCVFRSKLETKLRVNVSENISILKDQPQQKCHCKNHLHAKEVAQQDFFLIIIFYLDCSEKISQE